MNAQQRLGTAENPLTVAVIGSGPSGFYTTEALIRSDVEVRVDVFERLPAPYGLVRYGVAPDHPKLKQSILVFDKIAGHPEFRYYGNVCVGRDVTVAQLRELYHAIVFTCGAETDRRLGIDGEELPGSHTATEFVGWYNGHPDYRDREFDLSQETAVIIGQGNVAADVARILAKTVDELKATDIAAHALDTLAQSRIKEIVVVGRRGPAQAKFTPKELREFGELRDCAAYVDPTELELNAESLAELEEKTSVNPRKVVDLFRGFSEKKAAAARRCRFTFFKSPVRIVGSKRVEELVLERNRLSGEPFAQRAQGTGQTLTIPCGLLFRSIGYFGVPIDGVPFDRARGVLANKDGRIIDGSEPVRGLYAAGWIKRGPTGIIGTNRADSVATVAALLEDLEHLEQDPKAGAEGLKETLRNHGVRAVSFDDWKLIDGLEVARGRPAGKPREKFTKVTEMLSELP